MALIKNGTKNYIQQESDVRFTILQPFCLTSCYISSFHHDGTITHKSVQFAEFLCASRSNVSIDTLGSMNERRFERKASFMLPNELWNRRTRPLTLREVLIGHVSPNALYYGIIQWQKLSRHF